MKIGKIEIEKWKHCFQLKNLLGKSLKLILIKMAQNQYWRGILEGPETF